MGEWIEHDGKGMPCHEDAWVLVKLAGGYEETDESAPSTAGFWGPIGGSEDMWVRAECVSDSSIVAYKIVDPSPRPQHGGGAA